MKNFLVVFVAVFCIQTSYAQTSIEVRADGYYPYIDFSNDLTVDNDARIILWSDDVLSIDGARLFVQGLSSDQSFRLINGSYFSEIVKYQSGPFANNTGFLFRVEQGGTAGSSVMIDAMSITHVGNVGIGTKNPDAKLAVNGTVHAKEVKVDLNIPVPDYVFEPDYKLRTITDLSIFLQENGHLPEVPSAKEIEKSGLNLGDMNMILLKKIEELTLYVIQQQNQLKVQNEKLETQNHEIESLKTKLH